MLLVDDVDNKKFLRDLLEAMYDELPEPKKKYRRCLACGVKEGIVTMKIFAFGL